MTATETAPRPAGVDIPLLDPEPRRIGPVSRVLLARLVAGIVVVQAIGAWLVFGVATDAARSFGLGLVVPGGGFLFQLRPVAFLVTAALTVVALVLWWGVSFHLAIPLVWLGSAAAAWAMLDAPRLLVDDGTTWVGGIPLSYLAFVALVSVGVAKFERRFRAKADQVDEINEYLSTVELADPEPIVRDPNAMDVDLLRWCYALAHQPDDGLTGLDWGEQFHGGTQLRYQLNAHAWALCLYAANFLPNAQHQVSEAAARLIEKHTDLRVWKYWRALNLFGNFDANPDPIVRDNIMFSAFLGDVLNTYEAATGSDRFGEPGSLTFVWKDGRTFPYDHHSIVQAVEDNYERSRLGFFPCEPGWSFTVCNIMGAQSMHGYDVLHGTDRWERNRDRWQETLENEYLTPDGTYAHIRSNLVGVSWDTGEVPDGHYTANGTGRFADILPAHGRRARALDLRKAEPAMAMLASMIDDGDLPMDMPPEPERHKTRSSALPGWNKVMGGASMVGNAELLEAAITGAERQCATGKSWPDRPLDAGSSAFGAHLILRWSAPLSLAELHQRGHVPPTGPVVTGLSDDDVLVFLARSPDESSLDLGLSSDDGTVEVTVHLDGLDPRTYYAIDGTTFAADDDGRASVSATVAGITRLHLEKTAAAR